VSVALIIKKEGWEFPVGVIASVSFIGAFRFLVTGKSSAPSPYILARAAHARRCNKICVSAPLPYLTTRRLRYSKENKMFGDIAHFLLNTLFTLFGAALLLRAWLHGVKLTPYNPLSQGIFQATNWLVLPLRRVVPAARGIDWTSLFAAWLTAIVFIILMVAVSGGTPAALIPSGFIVALLTLVKWALNLTLWLTLVMALLSWVNPRSPAMAILLQLTAPFLNPLRRVLPTLGGIDLSPLALFVIVEVLLMIVTRITMSVAMFGL
jgi:YggT family protein